MSERQSIAKELERAASGTPSTSSVVQHPAYKRRQPVELLAAQPISLAGLPQAERDHVVVTAVADELGREYPVSRFADAVWHLAPETSVKNRRASKNSIIWPHDVPRALVDDAKAAFYCALRRGPHGEPWSASSVARAGREVAGVLRHLASLGIDDFSKVQPLHLSDYMADLRRTLKSTTVRHRLELIDLVWHFPMEVAHPLLRHPWGGDTLRNVCGYEDDADSPAGRTGKTPVIPRSAQRALFAHCETRLEHAESLLAARDAGRISPLSGELTALRDAVLYLTQISSGMRNSESMGITSNCWRVEMRNGVVFHWVHTRELKTGKGGVDYLVPSEALRALVVLQRYAQPLQARLAEEAKWLEALLMQRRDEDGSLGNGMEVAEAVERLNHVREIGQRLFLGLDKKRSDHLGTGSRIDVMSVDACNYQLKALARAAGTDWVDLSNHQCRRTFAYNVANSRLGRMGLVFLKWQLKHASMSWTQLYASNPYQDPALYREMEDEQIEARVELMEGWMQADAPLSGGAGKKLMQTRATPVRNLRDLLLHTATAIELRSTGHAWCISGTRGCHGQGVYEPTQCSGCSQAIIDRDLSTTWQTIHLENLRLAAITDCGPSVQQKAQRAVRRSEEVLNDLHVPLPSKEQAEVYERTGAIS
jgi:site-specific recombinase XerD